MIIVPLVNVSGFEHRTMSLVYEDGKNLNRVFPEILREQLQIVLPML